MENDPPYVEVEAHADSIGGHQYLARVRGVIETSCHRQLGSRRQAAIDDCTFLSIISLFSTLIWIVPIIYYIGYFSGILLRVSFAWEKFFIAQLFGPPTIRQFWTAPNGFAKFLASEDQ